MPKYPGGKPSYVHKIRKMAKITNNSSTTYTQPLPIQRTASYNQICGYYNHYTKTYSFTIFHLHSDTLAVRTQKSYNAMPIFDKPYLPEK